MCAELDDIIKKTEIMLLTETSFNDSTEVAVWWKDRSFRFLRYNQGMVSMLYPEANLETLIGKTDWEYAKDVGCSEEIVNRIKNCCSFSDKYLLESDQMCIQFYERCRVVGSTKDVWLHTVKTRIPPKSKGEDAIGVFGAAFVDELAGMIIESSKFSDHIEKLSNNCYRIIKKHI